jgi:hypothetical protein
VKKVIPVSDVAAVPNISAMKSKAYLLDVSDPQMSTAIRSA